MIIEEIKNIKNSRKEVRQFGIVMAVAFALLGALFLWRHKNYYLYLFIVSAVFFILSIGLPGILKPIQKTWMSIAVLIGWLVTRVILILLFYIVVTPISFLGKLFGKEFLDLKFNRNTDSYWVLREVSKSETKNYENQF